MSLNTFAQKLVETETGLDQELFRKPQDKRGQPAHNQKYESINQSERSNERTNERSDDQINRTVPPRKIIRQSFDLFEDQMDCLYDIQLKEKKRTGKKPTIGELAREAFDDLVKKKSA